MPRHASRHSNAIAEQKSHRLGHQAAYHARGVVEGCSYPEGEQREGYRPGRQQNRHRWCNNHETARCAGSHLLNKVYFQLCIDGTSFHLRNGKLGSTRYLCDTSWSDHFWAVTHPCDTSLGNHWVIIQGQGLALGKFRGSSSTTPSKFAVANLAAPQTRNCSDRRRKRPARLLIISRRCGAGVLWGASCSVIDKSCL